MKCRGPNHLPHRSCWVPVLVPERLEPSPLSVAWSVPSRCGVTMPEVRVELTRGCPHRILSPLPRSDATVKPPDLAPCKLLQVNYLASVVASLFSVKLRSFCGLFWSFPVQNGYTEGTHKMVRSGSGLELTNRPNPGCLGPAPRIQQENAVRVHLSVPSGAALR